MEWPDKPKIDLADANIVAVFTAYNEVERIPYFLSYYRALGVDHFLAIDNNSNDNTKKLLEDQPDVSYFLTTGSYVESKAGRLWTSELANYYCNDKWCLTLDLDEQLVYPGSEYISLKELCRYLDNGGYEGIFTVFLDMYSKKSLAEAVYTPGRPFLEVCNHFETDGYSLKKPKFFPQITVVGGPRQRIFWQQGKSGQGPSMRKMPLVKWRPGFEYVYSTHSCSPIRLADVTGALLHFKFFSSFKSVAERELARGDRVQKQDYENYVRLMNEQDICFFGPKSIKYEDSATLVSQGVTVCTRPYLNAMQRELKETAGRGAAQFFAERMRPAMRSADAAADLNLTNLPAVWPLLRGDLMHGGAQEPLASVTASLAGAGAVAGQLLSVFEGALYGWAADLNEFRRILQIEVTSGDRVWRGDANVNHPWLRNAPEGAQAHGFVIPMHGSGWLPGLAADKREIDVKIAGSPVALSTRVTIPAPGTKPTALGFEGYCDSSENGHVQGWVRDTRNSHRPVDVAVFVDRQFIGRVRADRFRSDLRDAGIDDGRCGFSIQVPRLFRDDGQEHRVDVVFADAGVPIARSPLIVAGSSVRFTPARKPAWRRLLLGLSGEGQPRRQVEPA